MSLSQMKQRDGAYFPWRDSVLSSPGVGAGVPVGFYDEIGGLSAGHSDEDVNK